MASASAVYPFQNDPDWQALVASATDADLIGPLYTYTSPHDPWLTNSYYLETSRGVLLFDTQTFRSSVEQLWEQIQATTSGRLYGTVITHAHPDHFFGNEFLRSVAPQAFILTSRAVDEEMRATGPLRAASLHEEYGDEVSPTLSDETWADIIIDTDTTLQFRDLTVELRLFGPSEARGHVTAWVPQLRALIAGDIVQNRQHYWLGEREFPNWYVQVEQLAGLDAATVHTGHQGVGGPELLTETKRWIATYLGMMAERLGPGHDPQDISRLDADGRAYIKERLKRAFPDWYDEVMTADGTTAMQFCLEGRDTATEPAARAVQAQRDGS